MIRYIAESDDDAFTLHEPSAKAYLVLLTNDRVRHAFPLRNEQIDGGRYKDNGVDISDHKVSRHHAALAPIDDTFILTDKGSANGTYLNGVLISQPIRLKDQDRITIGDTTFLFTAEMPASDAIIRQPGAISLASPAKAASANAPPYATALSDKPTWLLVGCLGLVIVGLLLLLAVLLGLFLGRSQVAGTALLEIFWPHLSTLFFT